VRVKGQRQSDVAARYGLSQKRVSAICQQIDDWHEWVTQAANFDELAGKQRRTVHLQCRHRAQQLLLVALERAAARQQEVTEVTRMEKGQTVVQRTVREVPADPAYFQVAEKLLRDLARIDLALGVDVESSWRIEEADLLAGLAGLGVEGASARVPECESVREGEEANVKLAAADDRAIVTEPKEGCNYSTRSNDKGSLRPIRAAGASGQIAADGGKATTYARSAEERKAALNREKRRKFFER
jgi:hypothetical protein